MVPPAQAEGLLAAQVPTQSTQSEPPRAILATAFPRGQHQSQGAIKIECGESWNR